MIINQYLFGSAIELSVLGFIIKVFKRCELGIRMTWGPLSNVAKKYIYSLCLNEMWRKKPVDFIAHHKYHMDRAV